MPGAVSDKRSSAIYSRLSREIIEDFLRRRDKGEYSYSKFYFLPVSKSSEKAILHNKRNKGVDYKGKGNSLALYLLLFLFAVCFVGHLLVSVLAGVPLDNGWLELSFMSSVTLLIIFSIFLSFSFPTLGLNFSTFKKHFSTALLVSINRDLSKGVESPEAVFSRYRVEERLTKLLEDEETSKDKN